MDKIKVAICDDAPYVVDCLKMKMDCPGIEVTGTSHSASDCVKMLGTANADVLLIDIQMETPTAGIDIIPEIKAAFPNLKIIMLTSFDDENYIFKAFSQGADNYILKSFEIDICKTIEDTFYNKTALEQSISKKLVDATRRVSEKQNSLLYLVTLLCNLSPVEYDVLFSIYNGATYKQIAKQRYVEECTIKTHAQRILKKTGMKNMKELIKKISDTQIFDLLNKENPKS